MEKSRGRCTMMVEVAMSFCVLVPGIEKRPPPTILRSESSLPTLLCAAPVAHTWRLFALDGVAWHTSKASWALEQSTIDN